jgi:hypothetical protein
LLETVEVAVLKMDELDELGRRRVGTKRKTKYLRDRLLGIRGMSATESVRSRGAS